MTFLGSILKLFSRTSNNDTPRKRLNPFVRTDVDPLSTWENIDVIGDGAFGKVHKARHKTDDHLAALKEMVLESDEDLEDMKVEIDILASCKHKYIVELLEAYLFENRLCLYLEFCGGGALDSIMQELCRALSETEIRHVCHCVLDALVFLHSRFIIHRDLKAGNILLTHEGAVKLADFGVSARNTDEKQRRDTFIGTPFWMAPEVITCETDKDNPYDNRADVWSLGITLIELAEMNPPHHEMHPMRLLIKVQRSPAPQLSRPRRWSPEFPDFLKRCLVKDPNQRAFAQDLVDDPFIAKVKEDDSLPLRQLVLEVHGEYVDTVEDGISPSVLHQSSISIGSLEKLTDGHESESNDSNCVTPQTPRRVINIGAVHLASDYSPKSSLVDSTLPTPPAIEALKDLSPLKTHDASIEHSNLPSLNSAVLGHATSPQTTGVVVKNEADSPAKVGPPALLSDSTDTPASISVDGNQKFAEMLSKEGVRTEPKGQFKKMAPALPIQTPAPSLASVSAPAPTPTPTPVVVATPTTPTTPTSGLTATAVPTPTPTPVVVATPTTPTTPSGLTATAISTQTPAPTPTPTPVVVATPTTATTPTSGLTVTAISTPTPSPTPTPTPVVVAAPTTATTPTSGLTAAVVPTPTRAPAPTTPPTPGRTAAKAAPPNVLPKPKEVLRHAAKFEMRAAELAVSKTSGAATPRLQTKDSMARLIQGFESKAKPPPAPPKRTVSIKSDPSTSSAGVESKVPTPKSNHSPIKEPEPTPEPVPVAVPAPAENLLEGLAEEILEALMEDVCQSDDNAPSVPFVVLDVMQEEFEDSPSCPEIPPPQPEDAPAPNLSPKEPEAPINADQKVMTTDIDAIVVTDNRTKADVVSDPDSAGAVRLGAGFGAVSAIVAHQSNLDVNDNREGATTNGEANGESSTLTEDEDKANASKMSARRRHSQFRTLTRTRTFVIDGQEKTTTTRRVVIEGLETKEKEDYANRKQDIREMRLLQKQEKRQHNDLMQRSENFKSELDARLRNEELALQKQYDSELEVMQRQHKVQLERAEQEHNNELRYSTRRVRTGQERELRQFREQLKQELKSVRQQVDSCPKDRRKEMMRQRMEEKELEHAERERDFQSKLAEMLSAEQDRMTVKHRQKLGQMENNFLRLKHNLRRRFEEDRWGLEQSHMYLRHQMARERFEEFFQLKRDQTAHKQTLERNRLAAMIAKDKAYLLATQAAEKKRQPKALRAESKTRVQMFRQSLRVPGPNAPSSTEEERERIRVYEEAERERVRAELDRVQRKHAKMLETMQLSHSTLQRELEQLQAEKKKELMDQDIAKIREIDEYFQRGVSEYEHSLKEKRQTLEAELEEELRRQKEFYTLSDDGPNVQIRELPPDSISPITDLDSVPVTN